MGLGSHVAVTNIMVTKAATNLRYWGESEGLVDDTLALLLEMTAGYSSSRLLAELDAMKYMVGHHTVCDALLCCATRPDADRPHCACCRPITSRS